LVELGYPNNPDFVGRKIEALSQSTKGRILVAIFDSQITGVLSMHIILLFHQEGNLCRITALVLKEKFRRTGIGRKLMESAEVFARVNDCIRIEITSGEHRTDAHIFYTKIGYRKVSKRFLKDLYE